MSRRTRISTQRVHVRLRRRLLLNCAMPSRCVAALFIAGAAAAFGVGAGAQSAPVGPAPPVRASTDTAPGALTVAGSVTDTSGAVVGGAIVALIGGHDTTVTDDSGRFVLHLPQAGAYTLSVSRLGFAPQYLAGSVSSERASRVTVTLIRPVPVLPTITTTDERRAYQDVGFDRRSAGAGYFLTYDQIARKQAKAFGDLLVSAPGLVLVRGPQGWMVSNARFSCVSYMVDGHPLSVDRPYVVAGTPAHQLAPGDRVGTAIGVASPDGFIDANDVGAIEYYESAERPGEFGSGACALVVIWTRTRLGLP